MKVNSIDSLQEFIEALSAPSPKFSDIKSKFCLLKTKVSKEKLGNFDRKIQQKNDNDLDSISNSLSRLKESYEDDYQDFVIKEKIDAGHFEYLYKELNNLQKKKSKNSRIVESFDLMNDDLRKFSKTISENYNFNIDISNLNLFITIVDYEIKYRDSLKRMKEQVVDEIHGQYKSKVKDIITIEAPSILGQHFFKKDLITYLKLIDLIIGICALILAYENKEEIMKFVAKFLLIN